MALSKNITDELKEDFVHCSICMERYKNPRMLPCVHSFCLKCLENCERNLKGKSFTCPTCRRVVNLLPDGVKGLPNNFFIVSLMEKLDLADKFSNTAASKCSFCREANGELYCLDCKLYLCKTCQAVHSRIPGTHEHTVAETKNLSNPRYMEEITVDQAPRCENHPPEKLRFFCNNCDVLVCRDCMLLCHQGHECIEAKSMAGTVRNNLQSVLEDIDLKSKIAQQESLEVSAKNVHDKTKSAQTEIEIHYSNVVARLQSDKRKLIAEVQGIGAEQSKVLEEQSTMLANWIKAAENTQAMTRKILQENNEWQIIGMEKHLTSAINKLNGVSEPFTTIFGNSREYYATAEDEMEMPTTPKSDASVEDKVKMRMSRETEINPCEVDQLVEPDRCVPVFKKIEMDQFYITSDNLVQRRQWRFRSRRSNSCNHDKVENLLGKCVSSSD